MLPITAHTSNATGEKYTLNMIFKVIMDWTINA